MSGLFQHLRWCTFVVAVSAIPVAQAVAHSPAPLTLTDAQSLALATDPLVPQFADRAAADLDRSVAERQLPDPKLRAGLLSFPTNSFSRSTSDFTELEVGVSQVFPPGYTLQHRGEKAEAEAGAEQARAADEARKVLRAVRNAWLEVSYQTQAIALLRRNEKLFTQITRVTEAHFGAGAGNQQDVINAGLEAGLLEDREADTETARGVALAELAKWIGEEPAARPISMSWSLPPLRTRAELAREMNNHPLLHLENAMISAGESEVAMAHDQYKPGWDVSVFYDQRAGGVPGTRPDFLSAMVTLDLPLFTDKRQDRRLAASQKELFAARYARDDRRRELQQILDEQYSTWTRLGERLALYERRLLPESRQNTQAALNAYQASTADFTTLVRARVVELETQLSALRLRTNRAKAHANLLYLAGDEQ